ncbi:MAG: response regulator, partial [Bdellovibrionaceae bacterium]|nr:response regulator [Pseudobdellovibrionaceae bacterium]
MSFRILVIDDDEDILVLMTRILGREGFVVETAKNGRIALESIRVSRPDFIVCDVRMPVCDGFEFD